MRLVAYLRAHAPGLYIVLNAYAKRIYGRSLSDLTMDEVKTIINMVYPSKAGLLERILFPEGGFADVFSVQTPAPLHAL